ncbi:Ribonuclease H-like protein, partial [Dioscorea alata]
WQYLILFVTLKLLVIAGTHFALVIIVLTRFKLIKRGLQTMVISEEWCSYKENDVSKAIKMKEIILNDSWWDKMDYILSFTTPIYDMFQVMDTNKHTLHLVYEMWDTMIENVKKIIYIYEHRQLKERSTFYEVIYAILIDRWTKSSTPLHCMTHSLNPRIYGKIISLVVIS